MHLPSGGLLLLVWCRMALVSMLWGLSLCRLVMHRMLSVCPCVPSWVVIGQPIWLRHELLWALIPMWAPGLTNSGMVTLVLALRAVGPAFLAEWLFRRFGLAHATSSLIDVGSLTHSVVFLRTVIMVLRPLRRNRVVLLIAVSGMRTRLHEAALTNMKLLLLWHRHRTVCPLIAVALIPILVPNA